MKSYLSSAIIALFTGTILWFCFSCSSGAGSPEQVTLHFFDLLYNKHDIEKAELLVTDNSRDKLRNDFKFIEGALQVVEKSKPTKYKYEVLKDKTEVKKDSAFVVVTSTLDTSQMKILLLNINEEWKIDFNYDEHEIKSANKGLVDEVLDLMEGFVDTVEVDSSTIPVKGADNY